MSKVSLSAAPATAPLKLQVKPRFACVGKLTRTPARVTEADAQAVYDAGWSESALFDAVQCCAFYNFMNRIIEGTGVAAFPVDPAAALDEVQQTRRDRGYTDWGREIAVLDRPASSRPGARATPLSRRNRPARPGPAGMAPCRRNNTRSNRPASGAGRRRRPGSGRTTGRHPSAWSRSRDARNPGR